MNSYSWLFYCPQKMFQNCHHYWLFNSVSKVSTAENYSFFNTTDSKKIKSHHAVLQVYTIRIQRRVYKQKVTSKFRHIWIIFIQCEGHCLRPNPVHQPIRSVHSRSEYRPSLYNSWEKTLQMFHVCVCDNKGHGDQLKKVEMCFVKIYLFHRNKTILVMF